MKPPKRLPLAPASEPYDPPPSAAVPTRLDLETTIGVEFTFSAGHWLPNVPPAHKCSRQHGHNYTVRVEVAGPVDSHLGWVMDYGSIRTATDVIRSMLDHQNLNEIQGLENPTAEVLAAWIAQRLHVCLPGPGHLAAVTVQETPHTFARVVWRA